MLYKTLEKIVLLCLTHGILNNIIKKWTEYKNICPLSFILSNVTYCVVRL